LGLIGFNAARRRSNTIYYPFILLASIFVIGIGGYSFIEGYSFEEAVYMTVITISTVGFSEVQPLSSAGRMFTVGLILTSFGTFAYAISQITRYVVDGELEQYLYQYRVVRNISKLEGHTIICGYGRNGRQAVKTLLDHNETVVVVEKNPEMIAKIKDEESFLYFEGDASVDKTLIDAGLKTAKALITTLPNDADNLFVTLSARVLNPKIKIISRASEENSDSKLRHAGVSNVIMPDKVGGAHMAQLVVKPDVVEFMDILTGQATSKVHLEEINSNNLPKEFLGKSISSLDIRKRFGANIIGFKSSAGNYEFNPSADAKLEANIKLFV
jgi:voltage-gated potassium channel